jgi:hypothetical protein
VTRASTLVALLLSLGFAGASPAAADSLDSELRRFLHDEASAVVHLRSYLLDRSDTTPPKQAAIATGGWIGVQSGWLYDTLQLGAVGYTTQPIWGPQDTAARRPPTARGC